MKYLEMPSFNIAITIKSISMKISVHTRSFTCDCQATGALITGFLAPSAVKNLPAMQETQETVVPFLGWGDPLEEGMGTHSSILVWRIPMDRGAWQATVNGLQGVRHN